MRCTAEEKQHMIDLIREVRQYAVDAEKIRKLPIIERKRIGQRMKEILAEMETFRRKYPDD